MPEQLLDLIETINAGEASVQRLFGSEGRGVRSARSDTPRYRRLLLEAVQLYSDVLNGRRGVHYLQEAMSTDDFPLLFGDVLDRQMLAAYREAPAVYPNFVRIARNIPDFRDVKRFAIDGGDGQLAEVKQLSEYPETHLDESKYQYAVKKYGRRISFSWESNVNADLDFLRQIPDILGRGARRTEQKQVTQLYVDANGPHASLYTSGNKNIVNTTNGASSNNPVLTTQSLGEAITILSKQTDASGEPIVIDAVELVVPPALRITAEQIVNTTEYRVETPSGSTRIVRGNGLGGNLRVSVDPYIPIVASTANGNTSWFVFANPDASRPALEVGFLRGHNEPETFIKEPNQRRVGGGAVNPLDGDFETDGIAYKVRHVMGGTREDPKATVASNGSAS